MFVSALGILTYGDGHDGCPILWHGTFSNLTQAATTTHQTEQPPFCRKQAMRSSVGRAKRQCQRRVPRMPIERRDGPRHGYSDGPAALDDQNGSDLLVGWSFLSALGTATILDVRCKFGPLAWFHVAAANRNKRLTMSPKTPLHMAILIQACVCVCVCVCVRVCVSAFVSERKKENAPIAQSSTIVSFSRPFCSEKGQRSYKQRSFDSSFFAERKRCPPIFCRAQKMSSHLLQSVKDAFPSYQRSFARLS